MKIVVKDEDKYLAVLCILGIAFLLFIVQPLGDVLDKQIQLEDNINHLHPEMFE